MSICSQASQYFLTSFGCFIYNFQTLLTGLAAIGVAVVAGLPVWRQLKDSNLQTRISHRETLVNMLRDALRRYSRVDKSIREPLATAQRVVFDPIGEPEAIDANDAHHLENMFRDVLDWYLVVLADTEHHDIETRKVELKAALDRLVQTLSDAHWADHNEQSDEDHDISDDDWAKILARNAAAKIDASEHVREADAAYRTLQDAQQQWVQSLRAHIASLDRQISAPQ